MFGYFRSLFIIIFIFGITCNAVAADFTGNTKLNSFLKECYIRLPKDSKYKVTDLRLVQIARRSNQGGWIISIRNKQNKILASFQAGTGFDEKRTILPIESRNEDRISGYVIVDWAVIKDSTNNWSYDNDEFTLSAAKLKNSPRIRKFLKIPYTYVSTNGNNNNDGTELSPLKSIAFALKFNKPIKLKRGDVFYENLIVDGCDISAYGQGRNPKICGWKTVPANKGLWEEGLVFDGKWIKAEDTHIWRIDLETNFAKGRISSNLFLNNIGLIINNSTGESIGHKCEFLYASECNDSYKGAQNNTYLQKEGDFWQCSKKGNEHFSNDDFRYLYIYCEKNPNIYSYSFSTYGNGFNLTNSTVDGVDVEGFGCHGFSCGNRVKIIHCTINYIGGSQQIGYSQWVRFGNGVEFYGVKEYGEIAFNTIMHTFDCGTTIQGGCGDSTYTKNITFHDNVIRNCRQALEYSWHRNKKTNFYHDVENCSFYNNKCTDNGHNNGFNSPEIRDTHILSYQWDGDNTSMLIEGNTFIGGNGFLCAANPNSLTIGNNVYYLDDGAILWTDYSGKDKIVYTTKNSVEAVKAFEQKIGSNKLKIKEQ